MSMDETTSTNASTTSATSGDIVEDIKALQKAMENRPPVPIRFEVNERGMEAIKREAKSVGTMAAGGSWFTGLPVCRDERLEAYSVPVVRIVKSDGTATLHELRSGAKWEERDYVPLRRSADQLVSEMLDELTEREAQRSLIERINP